jgi:excisionase family DNA binding protein
MDLLRSGARRIFGRSRFHHLAAWAVRPASAARACRRHPTRVITVLTGQRLSNRPRATVQPPGGCAERPARKSTLVALRSWRPSCHPGRPATATRAPHHLTLSTQQAADLLHISRTTLVRLLETGVIPFEKPSRHRKVRLDDLLEYRRRQRNAAELALTDMIADTERLGLYDVNPDQARAALKAARKTTQG